MGGSDSDSSEEPAKKKRRAASQQVVTDALSLSPQFFHFYILLNFEQPAPNRYLAVIDAPKFMLSPFCAFITAAGLQLESSRGVRIDTQNYIEFETPLDMVRIRAVCSRYCSEQNVRSCEIVIFEDSNPSCQMFLAAEESETLLSWTKPNPDEKLGSKRYSFDSSIEILKSCLDSKSQCLDRAKVEILTPRVKKANLVFSSLNAKNSARFCMDAVDVIVENILVSCASGNPAYYVTEMKETLDRLQEMSARGTLESGIALCLLVHASKAAKLGRKNIFVELVDCLTESNLEIVRAPSSFEGALELLRKQLLRDVLLQNTCLSDSALDEIETKFVNVRCNVRGWCGPSMTIINVWPLRETMHLDDPVAMFALLGHETKHAVVRKSNGNVLNFSSPSKPDLVKGLEFPNRESGLWFEMNAIGQKFDFRKGSPEVLNLIKEIRAGLDAGSVPALSEQQIPKFAKLFADCNEEFGFECPRSAIIEF
jgi:hypothetical protein